MTARRLQHVVPAGAVLATAGIVLWLSFTREPAGAFLFPRVISVVFAALALWNFVRAASGMARVGGGVSAAQLLWVAPGLAVMVLLVALAARALGFYVGATLAFFAVYTIYDPAPLTSGRSWLRRATVTFAFMAVIYALFALLLRVQTPRGAFF